MTWNEVITAIVAGISIIITAISLIVALRSGILKRVKNGSLLEIEAAKEAHSLITSIYSPTNEHRAPFETEHLARYYAQILIQSNIAFWFSLVFGSLGFTVIVAAAFMYSGSNVSATVIQGTAGVIVNTVAALFFVQSKRAQESMAQFFDKLRIDRHRVESRVICESLHDPIAKDALRIQLSLFYAGVTNYEILAQHIIESCFSSSNHSS